MSKYNREDDTAKWLSNHIGEVMNKGVSKELHIPIQVNGEPDLICRLEVTIPRAVKALRFINSEGHMETKFIHGKWNAEKQMIDWEDD